MLLSDLRAVYESYQNIYEEGDGISCEMIEEIVEELIEECLEFGHNIDEAADVVEEAAIQYLMELNPYAAAGSKEARAYAKSTTATKRGEARKTAVKAAKEKVKAKVKGAAAAASIGASIAKDEARRAGRKAAHAVSSTVQKKKAEVKSGVKSMIGRGLRKAAGAVGKVAQKAAGAASRLGEEVEIEEAKQPFPFKKVAAQQEKARKGSVYGKDTGNKPNPEVSDKEKKETGRFSKMHHASEKAKREKQEADKESRSSTFYKDTHPASAPKMKKANEEVQVDAWDVVLEFLVSEGHADTNQEAIAIMANMDKEMIQSIIETRMDPRGRPASGPMNVYAKNKPNTDPKFQAALKAVRDADAKKTPEQRKKELDAYKARKENS